MLCPLLGVYARGGLTTPVRIRLDSSKLLTNPMSSTAGRLGKLEIGVFHVKDIVHLV